MQQQPAYGIGRAAAVVQQFFTRGVAPLFMGVVDVLGECVEQVKQGLQGNGVLAYLRGQWREHLRPLGTDVSRGGTGQQV